jgi:hypothetical protein
MGRVALAARVEVIVKVTVQVEPTSSGGEPLPQYQR